MDSIDIFIYVAEILIIVGAVIAIVMPLIKSLDNPGSLLKTGIGVAILAVVFFVAYSISDGEVLPKYAADPFNLTPGMSKFVGGSLITVYGLFIIAILGIVLTEINKAVK
jgi:NADH:ubiquinone oxidoreductase subunit 6 (subunit J)